jgi:hypothetical protein
MPYIMCPQCGTVAHVSVGDHKEWYERYHPGIPFGNLVPGLCYYCFQEIKEGDSIVVRKLCNEKEGVQVGDGGRLQKVWTSKDGSLYEVRMDSGKECYFIRSELRGLIGKEKAN